MNTKCFDDLINNEKRRVDNMNFLEEIKNMQKNRDNQENIVLNDILNYFKEQIYSDDFKKILKENYIKRAINNGKNNCELYIEFWEYSNGCSPTYIRVSCCGKFEIKGTYDDYSSYYNYKDIRLKDIHKRVCSEISKLLKTRLTELGLDITETKREDDEYRFGYYKERIVISW